MTASSPLSDAALDGQSAGPSGSAEAEWTFQLSSLPSLVEPVSLLVGVEDGPDGVLRMYLGARHKGLYVEITEPSVQEHVRRAWGSGGNVWIWPLPPAVIVHCDRIEAAS